jgi:hypothetical protein
MQHGNPSAVYTRARLVLIRAGLTAIHPFSRQNSKKALRLDRFFREVEGCTSQLWRNSRTSSGTFSVQVKDALGATSCGCAITISASLVVSCGSVSAGEVGVSFNSGPMTVSGGTGPHTYSVVGTLPAGLMLNTATGAVTGTPTAAGSFYVQVKDALGATSTGCATRRLLKERHLSPCAVAWASASAPPAPSRRAPQRGSG